MTIQKNDHLQNDPCIRIIKEEPVKTNQEFKQVFYIDKCRWKDAIMTFSSVEERAFEIITRKLGVEPSRVYSCAKLVEDLGADSLDMVDLVMEFEDRFDIDIDDSTMENIHTVKDIVDFLITRVSTHD